MSIIILRQRTSTPVFISDIDTQEVTKYIRTHETLIALETDTVFIDTHILNRWITTEENDNPVLIQQTILMGPEDCELSSAYLELMGGESRVDSLEYTDPREPRW